MDIIPIESCDDMGKVLAYSSQGRIQNNRLIATKFKRQDLFAQALSELKQQTGIDHMKVIRGDQKEVQRLKMKQYQDSLVD